MDFTHPAPATPSKAFLASLGKDLKRVFWIVFVDRGISYRVERTSQENLAEWGLTRLTPDPDSPQSQETGFLCQGSFETCFQHLRLNQATLRVMDVVEVALYGQNPNYHQDMVYTLYCNHGKWYLAQPVLNPPSFTEGLDWYHRVRFGLLASLAPTVYPSPWPNTTTTTTTTSTLKATRSEI